MKNITMIAAVGKNLELGKDNGLIWHLKGDLKFFKEQTMGKPIVMGYKTFESLPKLLPGRKHIILTRRSIEIPSVLIVHSIDELLEKVLNMEEVMIIGGASIYEQMLTYSEKIILTEIDAEADADVYFPMFDKEGWDSNIIGRGEDNSITYKHLVYTRKKS